MLKQPAVYNKDKKRKSLQGNRLQCWMFLRNSQYFLSQTSNYTTS